MSDDDIDFRAYSLEQLESVLRRIDRDRYPRNFENAQCALREKRDEARPVAPPPGEGARRFKVTFLRRKAATENDGSHFSGLGWVDIGAGAVTVAIAPNGTVTRTWEFARSDLVTVETSETDGYLLLRDRKGVSVNMWLMAPAELTELRRLLPSQMSPEDAERIEKEREFASRMAALAPRAWFTPVLIGLNVLVFAVMAFNGAGVFETDSAVHVRFGSNLGLLTWTGEPWRLLTSAFLHFGVMHLAFNMYALHKGGVLAERLYGSPRFLVIYLLAAIAGSVVSGWWNPLRNSAGASGAVFGVYGALLVFFAMRRHELPISLLRTAGRGALLLVVYSLIIGATSEHIDNACHVGGLLAGGLAGWLLIRPLEVEARRVHQPGKIAGRATFVVAALAVLASPLWSIGTARHAELAFYRVIHDFRAEEDRLVDLAREIVKANEAGKLDGPRAAARLNQEVIVPWHVAAAPLLALSPPRAHKSSGHRRFVAFQEYLAAREHGMRLHAQFFEGRPEFDQAAFEAVWGRVTELIEVMKAGETSAPAAGPSP
jgi:rhomboid protease GluP